MSREKPVDEARNRFTPLAVVKSLGPGLISGASDNDPTTVATMAVLGSTTVYGLSWLTILVFPILATVQFIAAQVGLVSKRGLQQAVRELYGVRWGLVLLVSILAVNLFTVGADLEGGAAALGLLFGVAWQWFMIPLAAVLLVVLVIGSYDEVESVLKYVLLVFAAYIISAFLAHPKWGDVLHNTVLPPLSLNSTYVQGALALLGTTLTSYAYVWETIQEAREREKVTHLGLARADAGFGMFFAVGTFWFILVSTGTTLGLHHKHVATAQQAAQALRPAAGPIASDIFAIGLLASAVIAVPVLVASSAHIIGTEFRWSVGLSKPVRQAKAFYAALVAVMTVGVLISFLGISPIQILFIAGIIGGLGTPISLAFLLLVGRARRVMDGHAIGRVLMVIGWIVTTMISAISLFFLWQQFGSKL
ncbi:MAG TPA: divalent metal cation transporter [Chloroflexota bacterium]|nr:divalent metal cation transporter [Chloroflexota bacterium]